MSEQEEPTGVVFPVSGEGRRSTAALGRAVVADALRPVDPVGARAAEQETNWRAGYLPHFRRLVEAGLASREDALTIAESGLSSLSTRMRVARTDGTENGLAQITVPQRVERLEHDDVGVKVDRAVQFRQEIRKS